MLPAMTRRLRRMRSNNCSSRIPGETMNWNAAPGVLLPAGVTLTRAGANATYFDSAGVLQTASANAARGTYLYTGSVWAFDGTLIEGAATNLHDDPTSQDSGVGWNAILTANTANASAWIDGTNKMMCTVWDGVTGVGSYMATYRNSGHAVTANTEYAIAVDLKWKQGTRGMRVYWTTVAFGSGTYVDVDLVNGVISSTGAFGTGSTTGTARIENCGGGIYRVMFSGKLDAASTTGYLTLGLTKAYQDVSAYTPNAGDGFYHCGCQIEVGNAPTSRILTAGATRNADAPTIAASGLLLNARGFSAIRYRMIADAAGVGQLFSTYNGGGIPLGYFSGNLQLFDTTASAWRVGPAFTPTPGNVYTASSTWGGANCALAANGAVVSGLTYNSLELGTILRIGDNVSAVNQPASMVLQAARFGVQPVNNVRLMSPFT